MEYTAEITEVRKNRIVSTGAQFLDVTIKIKNEKGKVVDTKHFGFEVDTKEKEIEAAAKKLLKLFIAEQEQSAQQTKVDKADANANKVIENLVGKEIK